MMSDSRVPFLDPKTLRYSNIAYISRSRLAKALTLAACLLGGSACHGSPGPRVDRSAPPSADAPKEDLVVHASGFTHDRGQAIASLFRDGDDVFGEPYARVVARVVERKATLVFPRLYHGSYAVIVFHDENGNHDLDHNFLRFPAEPLGYSNGFKLSLLSGLPNFEKLRFAFDAGAQPAEISVK